MITGPWLLAKLMDFTTRVIHNIPGLVG
jgi:flagellar biosynthesis protein FliQ